MGLRTWWTEYQQRRTRRRQIRELEQCLRVLRPALAALNRTPATCMSDIIRKAEAAATVRTAEHLIEHLRSRV